MSESTISTSAQPVKSFARKWINAYGGLYLFTVNATMAIALLGFVFNYTTLVEAARRFGVTDYRAYMFPLLIDAGMIVAHVVYFYFRINGQQSRLTAVVMYAVVGLSVAFSLSHAGWGFVTFSGRESWGQNAAAVLELITWSLAPVLLLVTVEMVSRLVEFETSRHKATETQADEAQWKGKATTAQADADRRKAEAARWKDEAERSQDEAGRWKDEAGRSQAEAARWKDEATKAQADNQRLEGLLQQLAAAPTKTNAIKALHNWQPKMTQAAIAEMTGANSGTVSKALRNGTGK